VTLVCLTGVDRIVICALRTVAMGLATIHWELAYVIAVGILRIMERIAANRKQLGELLLWQLLDLLLWLRSLLSRFGNSEIEIKQTMK
jgi:hypothetical protein